MSISGFKCGECGVVAPAVLSRRPGSEADGGDLYGAFGGFHGHVGWEGHIWYLVATEQLSTIEEE